jgi:hypothetical protein
VGRPPLIAAAPARQGLTRAASRELGIDQNNVGAVLAQGRLAAGAVARRHHLVALGHEHGPQQGNQALVCIGDHDSHARPQGWPPVNR